MQLPPIPPNEALRVATLRSLNILDTPYEERFDRLTRLAKRLFDVPIAVVSLIDTNRQFFKACEGLDGREAPRDTSFCGHAINCDDILLITDATQDPRFHDNPLVTGEPNIRFYAGCPLAAANGVKLGTLCLVDRTPREFGPEDRALLHDLAQMAEQELAAVQLATMDELTSLSNRRGFAVLGQHAVELCRRLERPATLVFFDMDGFKLINDQLGHAEGDRALMAFGAELRAAFRESDVVGRLGGDEFAALLTNTDLNGCTDALARLHAQVAAWNARNPAGYALRYSTGAIAFTPPRHGNIHDLLAGADAAMYRNKAERKAAQNPQ